jgi:glyoxylase-like metal-dependent hydrolase (beta-lactamase superfamily II)
MVIPISKNIYQISAVSGRGLWGGNVFLLTDRNLTLVDTGYQGGAGRIISELNRLGYTPSDIANIVITHHHADHVGNLFELKRASRATVFAHPADAPYIDSSLPQPGPARPRWLSRLPAPLHRLWSAQPAAVDIPVTDGDELPILGGARVLHTPGHTPGSICLLLHKERLIIVGDVLNNRFGLGLPSKAFSIDMAQNIRAIKRLAALDLKIVCFGHGSPLTHNASAAILNLARRL